MNTYLIESNIFPNIILDAEDPHAAIKRILPEWQWEFCLKDFSYDRWTFSGGSGDNVEWAVVEEIIDCDDEDEE